MASALLSKSTEQVTQALTAAKEAMGLSNGEEPAGKSGLKEDNGACSPPAAW